MLDTYVAQQILSKRQIAYLTTDRALTVDRVGGNLQFLMTTNSTSPDDQPTMPLTTDSITGKLVTDVVPELVGYEEQLAALASRQTEPVRLDMVNRESKRGATVYLDLVAYSHEPESGHPEGVLLVLEDVTFMGNTAQHLTQQHNELYLLHQELSKSNLQLAAANAELRALDELKSRFVSIAAHELRTPIASIIGYIEFVLFDEIEPPSKNQRQSLTVAQRSGRRLLNITSDLLDITRLETGRLELMLESINLSALVQAMLVEFQPDVEAKALELVCQVLDTDGNADLTAAIPAVLCDEKRTIQIFNNLLGNAVKYTPAHGRITVTIAADTADGTVTVEIVDTGIGIPAADLRQLGKAFFRATNVHKARTQGTGLGLHITHSLLELQGGTLTIQSVEGQGTTVSVALPIDDGIFETTTDAAINAAYRESK